MQPDHGSAADDSPILMELCLVLSQVEPLVSLEAWSTLAFSSAVLRCICKLVALNTAPLFPNDVTCLISLGGCNEDLQLLRSSNTAILDLDGLAILVSPHLDVWSVLGVFMLASISDPIMLSVQ